MAASSQLLETFVIDEPTTTASSSEQAQGMNSARFAITGLLASRARPALSGLEEEMRLSGFSERNIESVNIEPTKGGISSELGQIIDFLQNTLGSPNSETSDLDRVRQAAWQDINENRQLSARVALLASAICSPYERESAIAAMTLIANLKSALPILGRPDDADRFWAFNGFNSRLFGLSLPFYPSPFGIRVSMLQSLPSSKVDWDGDFWSEVSEVITKTAISNLAYQGNGRSLLYVLSDIAWMRIEMARRSKDAVIREIVGVMDVFKHGMEVLRGSSRNVQPATQPFSEDTSVMVHGTWGWKGKWWNEEGDFHPYIRKKFTRTLYRGGQEFSWSGAYSESHRKVAAKRFERWISAENSNYQANTVFAHSLGADVVARAVESNVKVNKLVLLSAPIDDRLENVIAGNRVGSTFDIRLPFDFVLALDALFEYRHGREVPRQRIKRSCPYTQVILRSHYWAHSASHRREIWVRDHVRI